MSTKPPEMAWVEVLHPELTAYCYRMLGCVFDAEDAVQDTMLRAWKGWDSFRNESSPRTWIYRIATNVCLDKIRKSKRRVMPMDFSDPVASVGVPTETLPLADWVWPVPDNAIDPVDVTIRKDTIRLAFIAALQTLPPRQRAVLILQDVYRWPASQTASVLGTSITAVNSALQRARLTLSRANFKSEALNVINGELNQELIDRYVDAFERYDINALLELFHEDGSISMPPFVMWISGRANLVAFYEITRSHCVGSRLLPTRVNGTVALAQYAPSQSNEQLVPWGIHVPEIRDNQIIHVHTFIDPALYTLLDLPTNLDLTI